MEEEIIDIAVEKEVVTILQFQDKLLSAIEEDIPDICRFVIDSKLAKNHYQLSILAQNILIAARVRAFTLHVIVTLIGSLYMLEGPDNCLEDLPKSILERFSLDIQRDNIIDTVIGEYRFIRVCMNHMFFKISEISNFISDFSKNYSKYTESNALLLCYFAGDIYEYDQTLFTQLFNKMVYNHFRESLPKCINEFIPIIGQYLKSGIWNEWRDLSNRFSNTDPLSEALRKDNIDEFNGIIDNYGDSFDWNQKIKPNIFEQHFILQDEPTILQFSAFFGSKKCYERIILSNKASFDVLDNKGRSVLMFAVAGWKQDLIKDLANKGCSFDGSLKISAEYYITSFFEYIDKVSTKIENKDDDFDTLLNVPSINMNPAIMNKNLAQDLAHNGFESFLQAAKSNNFYILNFFIRNGVDPNVHDVKNRTALHFAASHGNFSVGKYLLTLKGINPNIHDNDWNTPLHIAVNKNETLVVKELCSSCKIDVSATDATGETPLHNAATSDLYIDIVKILLENQHIEVNITDNAGIYYLF
ncbi:hypothetical protein TRFO_15538 [Tritrichomonas foetus]|uniref:DUF3447 domain-containing protein n=1 Tax=Tritrichomonas foetus TaxID=1144522 RepID=A0A1J4KTL1_9EUKA|nr:hypothetical protein TRFO_15538 [Tritrichomonas foetus]|eukprot:OHT14232.1 hypothetical protein TRFO_15538 [Tritrichomonas foetus]